MALKATIFKAELEVSDLDRQHYASHVLTLARHPSETDERMMVRLLAFALNADEALTFTRGLSTDDEPALWRMELGGEIAVWIEVGQPEERRIRRACGRAGRVIVYSYGGRAADLWWAQNAPALSRLENLTVIDIPAVAVTELGRLAQRNMRLSCTVQEGQVWLSDGERTIEIQPAVRMGG